MTHKCKLRAYRYQRRRSKKTMSYKCHGCFLVIVVRKRLAHRMLTRPGYRATPIVTRYYDVNDPRYQAKAISEEQAWRELFSFEFNHS